MTTQFQQGHDPPTQFQSHPGFESKISGEKPEYKHLPTRDGGYQLYKAAGKLQGQRALITGGDSGIGRSIATLYAMEGADVFIQYLPSEEEDAKVTRKEVQHYGRKVYSLATDLRKSEDCKKLVDEAIKQMGGLNILVLNHAYQQTRDGDIGDWPEEQWHTTFDTNVHSFFYTAKYARPHLHAGDAIIICASINAYIGRPDLLDYTATKGALVSFTRGLSNQLIGKGIRVNAVAPGPVWTPLVPATMGKTQQENLNTPMGRPNQPSEIGTVFVFLASMDSSAISGQTIHANGGVVVNG